VTGRDLPPSSPYAADGGGADPALAAALAAHADGGDLTGVVAALAAARVLVPVLARLERTHDDGPDDPCPPDGAVGERVGTQSGADDAAHGCASGGEKEASAGVVAVRTRDGRVAMPVFSGVAAMAAWRSDARPVPTPGPRAALAALAEGWQVLLVDAAGPASAVVPRPAVVALAQGVDWVPAVRGGVVDPLVVAAVGAALEGVPHVSAVEVAPGRRAEVVVGLTLARGLGRDALDAVIAQVNAALAADATVADRVDGLELRLRATP
jgi:hypothetical protein